LPSGNTFVASRAEMRLVEDSEETERGSIWRAIPGW
jgi:hypothetical protein